MSETRPDIIEYRSREKATSGSPEMVVSRGCIVCKSCFEQIRFLLKVDVALLDLGHDPEAILRRDIIKTADEALIDHMIKEHP